MLSQKKLQNSSSLSFPDPGAFTSILNSPITIKFSNFKAALFNDKVISSKMYISYCNWEDSICTGKTTSFFKL